MRKQIVFYWVLKVKYDNDFLIKEPHQVHTKARKIVPRLWVDDVVVDTGLLIPYLNFSGLNDVFAVVEFGREGSVVFLPICPGICVF